MAKPKGKRKVVDCKRNVNWIETGYTTAAYGFVRGCGLGCEYCSQAKTKQTVDWDFYEDFNAITSCKIFIDVSRYSEPNNYTKQIWSAIEEKCATYDQHDYLIMTRFPDCFEGKYLGENVVLGYSMMCDNAEEYEKLRDFRDIDHPRKMLFLCPFSGKMLRLGEIRESDWEKIYLGAFYSRGAGTKSVDFNLNDVKILLKAHPNIEVLKHMGKTIIQKQVSHV